jgi:hypothetical protein
VRFTSFDRLCNLTYFLTFVGRCILLRRSSILHLSHRNFASCSSVLSALFGVSLLYPFGIAKPTRNRDRHLFEYCQRTIGQRYRGTRWLLDEKQIFRRKLIRSRDRFCFVSPVHWESIGGYFRHSMYAPSRQWEKYEILMPWIQRL